MNSHSETEPASTNAIALGIGFSDVDKWQVQSPEGAWGSLESSELSMIEDAVSARFVLGGVGELICRPPIPFQLPEGTVSVQIWVHLPAPFDPNQLPELVVLFDEDKECSLGLLDFEGWHLLHKLIGHLGPHEVTGLAIRGLLARDEQEILLDALCFETAVSTQLEPIEIELPQVYQAPLSMLPTTGEEVTNTIEQDGISFLFEARSLSAVVRFIYTPIEGTFSDIELEINNTDPIKPAEEGGITIEMGGREWSSNDESIERHFVSCEQVGEYVEARWQWKYEEELADFLFRFRIEGKSLIIDLEGGSGKVTGVSLGYIAEAVHPRLIRVPYFNLGPNDPHILCTSGVFVSSLLDWYETRASSLFAPAAEDSLQQLMLNGGCTYIPRSDERRNPLHERWVLTVSRQFEEVLPTIPELQSLDKQDALSELLWYNISQLEPSEEAYVEVYERLLKFKQWGMDHILINHPPDTWCDGGGNATLTLSAAPAKGGDDALGEYLEALKDLGYKSSLYTNYRDISPLSEQWDTDQAARLPDGNLAPSAPGCYLLKPSRASTLAASHTAAIAEKYQTPVDFIGSHAASPPWDRIDCDSRLEAAASFLPTFFAEQSMLSAHSQQSLVVGEGGSHWLYPGLLHGYLARQTGPVPSQKPLLVDFDLHHLHPVQMDAGLGTHDQFFGQEIPREERHSRSSYFDHYLAATIAFGHAGYLPDSEEWGLPATIKAYYLLQKLQTYYLANPVASIHYHHSGNLLETTEALISGAYEHSQVHINYENGLQIFANGGQRETWAIEHAGAAFTLPPGSFLASSQDGLLVYSADPGSGRIDYAQCPDYFYCDTRGTLMTLGPITLDGAALILRREWEIDIYPLECSTEVKVKPAHFWPDRRLPRLRLLAFKTEEDEPETLTAEIADKEVVFQPEEEVYKYRITLPEWMVEPGQ